MVKKIICGQISPSSAWKEEIDTDSHADRIVELDFKRGRQEWKIFREEAEEVGVNIELAIFRVLVEEVLLDLVQLQPFSLTPLCSPASSILEIR